MAKAPRGPLIRDIVGVVLDPRGEWKVYAGLWRMSGDRSRVAIEESASAQTDPAGRVEVGSIIVE